jgi:small GTP-binding protein
MAGMASASPNPSGTPQVRSAKVALVGAYGVGKTSLMRRFISSEFSEKYHATLGVKVDKKTVSVDGTDLMLMIWDIAGAEDHFSVPSHYV